MQKITTFLMFTGNAEEAMNYYISLFQNSKIVHIDRYGKDEDGIAGSVRHAIFNLNGQNFMCIDSSIEHAFDFTPSVSLHVNCQSEAEIDHLFTALSKNGQVLMPLQKYPFSQKYAWVNDQFGVSWQLNMSN